MEEEARMLAARIVQTWAGGPTVEVWIEELELLEVGAAGTTFVRLRRERERAPSVATFLALYRTIDTRAPQRVECELCGGDGWIAARETTVRTEGEEPYRYQASAVEPCPRCQAGDHAKVVRARIAEQNQWRQGTD